MWMKETSRDGIQEKCRKIKKEKFEEETCRSFSSTIGGYNNNSGRYLISEDLYNNANQNTHHHGTNELPEINVNCQEQLQVREKEAEEVETTLEDHGKKGGQFKKDPNEIMVQPAQDSEEVTKGKKRKRKQKKFKMVQRLCVDFVNKMMAQQEEMHKRLLEDIATRDEEKIKREEAWRKEEMERAQREVHVRGREQEMARDRQSTITEFLNKITSSDQKIQLPFEMNLQDLQTNVTNIQKPIPPSEMTKVPASENQDRPAAKDEIGKRWPRDEVLALINIRSNVNNGIGGNSEEHQIGSNKVGFSIVGGSIWERISQGILELGYNRSAMRCKEKWKNINKYFRKIKDSNMMRSLDSRTCPYYHELRKLYNQEKQASSSNSPGLSSEEQENSMVAKIMPEN